MKKFRKLNLIPLTNFKELNLNVVKNVTIEIERNKDVDFTMNKLLSYAKENPEIVTIISTVGDENFVSAQIKSSSNKKKIYTFPELNPICIYYNIANEHLEKSYELKNRINLKEQNFNYFEDYEYFSNYFNSTSQGIIFLITTIEGFINQFFKENTNYFINGEIKTKKDLEWAKLDNKILEILPAITGLNFSKTNNIEYCKIKALNEIRNNLVHLKQTENANKTNYQDLFKKMIDFKQVESSEAVFTFLNIIKPNYFTEEKSGS